MSLQLLLLISIFFNIKHRMKGIALYMPPVSVCFEGPFEEVEFDSEILPKCSRL